MKALQMIVYVVVGLAFAIQSIVLSSAMISKTLTTNWLDPSITAAAGWITLILVVVGLISWLVHAMTK
jgi:type IV secretory pathway TrbL component